LLLHNELPYNPEYIAASGLGSSPFVRHY
jgi:hypothetical protein